MKAKYTEGPWTVGQVGSQPVFDLLGPDITGRGREVIGTIRTCQNRESNKANAALIASAPELFEVLEVMCRLLKNNKGFATADLNAYADKGRDILAKVRGRHE